MTHFAPRPSRLAAGLLASALVTLVSGGASSRARGAEACVPGVTAAPAPGGELREVLNALDPEAELSRAAEAEYRSAVAGRARVSRRLDQIAVVGTAEEQSYLDQVRLLREWPQSLAELAARGACGSPAEVSCLLTQLIAAWKFPSGARPPVERLAQSRELALRSLSILLRHGTFFDAAGYRGRDERFLKASLRGARQLDHSLRALQPEFAKTARGLDVAIIPKNNAACGLYYPTLHVIHLSESCLGDPGTTVHELMHAFQFAERGGMQDREFTALAWTEGGKKRLRGARFPSGYAKTNPVEHFAEAGMTFVLEADELRERLPDQYAFFRDRVFRGRVYAPRESGAPDAGMADQESYGVRLSSQEAALEAGLGGGGQLALGVAVGARFGTAAVEGPRAGMLLVDLEARGVRLRESQTLIGRPNPPTWSYGAALSGRQNGSLDQSSLSLRGGRYLTRRLQLEAMAERHVFREGGESPEAVRRSSVGAGIGARAVAGRLTISGRAYSGTGGLRYLAGEQELRIRPDWSVFGRQRTSSEPRLVLPELQLGARWRHRRN